ncbi:pilus assembly protein PilW [Pseudomonas oryzihabitans]|uniref:PilW family protein n=1 Tax=Pseudomonas oryzihabitans TaxID=47885 RepID=UPI000735E432|nr:prepilin-type N-terminal cleavage/methylation domain-containing protein [Pseudomonas psychrotolerans]KTT53436.1 pilus assembly protein PilW [Pseudomonas psychrotolerans]
MKLKLRGQTGFSLIEMMIALTVGTFLVLGVSQIYINNKRSFLFQQGQTGNRNNAQLTLQVLDRQLARTGFRSEIRYQGSLQAAFPAVGEVKDVDGISCPAFAAGATFAATTENANAPTGVCIRYQGALDGKDLDCLGNVIPRVNLNAGGNVLLKLRYAAGNTPGSGTLNCTVWSERGGALTRKGSAVLVQGLQDFRWSIPPKADAPAVRYAALLSTSDAVPSDVASTAAANWQTLTGQQIANADRPMQMLQSTVTLRNLTL